MPRPFRSNGFRIVLRCFQHSENKLYDSLFFPSKVTMGVMCTIVAYRISLCMYVCMHIHTHIHIQRSLITTTKTDHYLIIEKKFDFLIYLEE